MTPVFDHLKTQYGLDCALRYQAILNKPAPQKRGNSKPWFTRNPQLTEGMKRTIKRQYSEGRSVVSIAGRWGISTESVRNVLGLPHPVKKGKRDS